MPDAISRSGDVLVLRVERLEAEMNRQRDRIHEAIGENHAGRLQLQRLADQLEFLNNELHDLKAVFDAEVRSMRRSFNTWTFGIVGSVLAFALTVFAVFGPA